MSSPLNTKNNIQKYQNSLGFRYNWHVRVLLRQLGPNGENTILHISPKFATVHDHVSFQWTLKMHGIPERIKKRMRREIEQKIVSEGEEEEKEEEGEEEEEEEEEEDEEDEEEEESPSSAEKGYVAISLYYLDGPLNNVQLRAQVHVVNENEGKHLRDVEECHTHLEDRHLLTVSRGSECELAFKDHNKISGYIRQNMGKIVRLSLLIEMDSNLFRADNYLNAVSPTPIHSFLTANYRARVSSKVWRKCFNRRPRSASDGHHKMITGNRKLDLERTFNRVMERERERREFERCSSNYGGRKGSQRLSHGELIFEESLIEDEEQNKQKGEPNIVEKVNLNKNDKNNNLIENTQIKQIKSLSNQTVLIIPHYRSSEPHLFKKLLVACCESCERRASLTLLIPSSYQYHHCYGDKKNTLQSEEPFTIKRSCSDCELDREDEEDIPFECDEENKAEVHDTLANMYFNKVVLPEMDYVEDFVDFLIDAELNDLPVLKRACERYLCGELNTKKELMTSLILDLFFIAMVFRLPVMKSMTLTELCDRYHEMEDIGLLLEREEYRSLDKRIRQLCGDRNLADLIDECKRFREQCLRVQRVNFSIKNKVNN